MHKRIALLATVAAGLALSACGGKDEAEAPANVANMTPIEVENTATTVPTEAPAAPPLDNVTINTTHAETVPSDLSADEQTQDDADATGMTARVSRDEGGNEGQPAE